MGIFGQRYYFNEGLPKVQAIKDKFKEITGLYLGYAPHVHLDELMTEREDILFELGKSKGVFITRPSFSCSDFDKVYLGDYMDPTKNSFHIEASIRTKNMYFLYAFSKTIQEIGGFIFDYHTYPYEDDLVVEDYLKPYRPHEREWKSIKKWDEMSPVEKDGFQGKYADQ